MVERSPWQRWLERLYSLRRDSPGRYERPHKPVLLLAIMDLMDRRHIQENRVKFDQELRATFHRYFDVVKKHNDQPTMQNPFYYLSGDGFWHLEGPPGTQTLYVPGNVGRAPTIGALEQTAGHFDEDLWRLLINQESRQNLRLAMISRYFPDERQKLLKLVGQPAEPPSGMALNEEFSRARDRAFREKVLDVYDHTCAACGVRVITEDGMSLVEAAHLIPFEETCNDNPTNGMALCPNHHRAMDKHLIAPCWHADHEAGVWKVSRRIVELRDPKRLLVGLAGNPVLTPIEREFLPSRGGLDWREQRLEVRY